MANKIYVHPETGLLLQASTASPAPDINFGLTSLANGAGRLSNGWDRGAVSFAPEFRWAFTFRLAVAPTVGTTVRLYMITGHESGSVVDGSLSGGDSAVTSENLLRNATLIGSIICDEASNTKYFRKSGLVYSKARYVNFAVWNDTGQAFTGTDGDHYLRVFPMPDEVQ